jgi:hypothetical protein
MADIRNSPKTKLNWAVSEKVGAALRLYACIWEMSGLNIGRETNNLDLGFPFISVA